MTRTKALTADTSAWEAYRLHERDVLLSCFEDADLMLRRLKMSLSDAERMQVVAMLWDKRCQPWKYYRDEQRAHLMR